MSRAIPTSANLSDWRVLCSDGRVIASVHGHYAEVQASGVCSPARITGMWDNGLGDYGKGPPYLSQPGVLVFEPRYELKRTATDIPASFAPALAERRRALRTGGSCAHASCQDSARNQYDVTYLDGRGGGSTRLDCAAAGLLNGSPGVRDVPGTLTRAPAAQCRIGVTPLNPVPAAAGK
ncbi:MAG: hypothetical protein QOG72_703 [Sphingomonadales bacterium]|nr:hypothetical protein [Sphingomonadales bacterium]